MVILIFDTTLSGHHLEYINHIYRGVITKTLDDFVFAVPAREWGKKRKKREWPEAENVRWVMLDDEECERCNEGNLLVRCWRTSIMVKRYALKYEVNKILMISLAGVIPFLPLILPLHIKLSGIIYKIYLRSKKKGIRSLIDKFRFLVMAHCLTMDKTFILNDSKSTDTLNKIFHTCRFVFLPDPVPEVDKKRLIDLRPELNISGDKIMFLHFGAMNARKGTLVILKAILLLTQNQITDKVFIFAGIVGQDIEEEFWSLVRQCTAKGIRIIVMNEFVSYEKLNDLCYSSDIILAPYLLTDLSSGVVGYAAAHCRTIVGPDSGLIGELIRNNSMGVTLSHISPESLADVIVNLKPDFFEGGSCDYASRNCAEYFYLTLLSF